MSIKDEGEQKQLLEMSGQIEATRSRLEAPKRLAKGLRDVISKTGQIAA